MLTLNASYSPEDNKLRLYASSRLDTETYERVKLSGFKWAPKQNLFVAPMWTPDRAELLIELCGEIGDEDTSLVDRAEDRAGRFDEYSEKRTKDAEHAKNAVNDIAGNIPMGQPILVGHHSERRARKEAQRIESGMKKAIQMWDTAQYWTRRAAGAVRAAKYKERADVRARRIKGLEADKRKQERSLAEMAEALLLWQSENLTLDKALHIANYYSYMSRCFTLAEYPRDLPASQYEGYMSIYSALDGGIITVEQARDLVVSVSMATIEHCERWISHYENRIAYERAMLQEQGGTVLLDPKPRRELLPLYNYRAPEGISVENMYHRGDFSIYLQIEMTKAEYARINSDYKGARVIEKSHRIRITMQKHALVCVFITDSKEHKKPEAPAPLVAPIVESLPEPEKELRSTWTAQGVPEDKQNELVEGIAAKAQSGAMVGPFSIPENVPATNPASSFEVMRQQLRQGVKVVFAPQLFPTPPELAARMVALAELADGHNILEPSAGTGAIMRAIGHARIDMARAVAVEINPSLAGGLRSLFPTWNVTEGDFLSIPPVASFDRILLNPPFEQQSDIAHIQHALKMLKPGGRLVAICANGSRQNAKLRPIVEELGGEWEELPPNTFASSGTSVNTVLLSMSV
jgi:phospholipid N-methyltransferase